MQKNENVVVDPFKVYVRVRPFNERELSVEGDNSPTAKNKLAVLVEDKMVYVVDKESQELYGKKEKCFSFDDVFKEKDNNNLIFERIIKNLVNNIMLGYNSTALAYGVTGTGKTHTMFGDIYLNLNFEKGICMFAVDYLFDKINNDKENSYRVKINYLEIYNESVIDLLVEKPFNLSSEQHLMIVEDPSKGTLVPELTEYTVANPEQVINLIILGNSRRTMAPTGANQFSSRSHAILQINVEQRSKEREEFLTSKLLLVDLAGSERGSLEKGIRREEGANINKSLLALGNCINILSDKSKKGSFVPYRDSKLTRLLKDSLGGNISTIMIACISPSLISYDETINTLKYASRARRIQKKVTRNVKEIDHFNAQYKEIIDNLKTEILQLKDIIKNQNILIRNRPDSFREDRDLINLNLNLNLNINNGNSGNNGNNLRPSNNISNAGNYANNSNSYNNKCFINNHTNNNFNSALTSNNPDFFHSDNIPNIKTTVNLVDKKFSLNASDELGIIPNTNANFNLNNNNAPPDPKIKDFNFENYEDFLNKNLNQFTDSDFEDFEKKLEGLYYDKINLENQIQQGNRDSTINEKYTIVKTFYEKYIELINEKMTENIEQNMILKFNLKEILELNQVNTNTLYSIIEQLSQNFEDKNEEQKLLEAKINIKKTIDENDKEKEQITRNLENNMKNKKILKKLLFKFISNTQIKEIKSLQHAYIGVENDKRELEVKNKKYQEFLNAVLKEKEEKDIKNIDLNRELDRMKKKFLDKEKKLAEADKKIREMESTIKEQRHFQKFIHKNNIRTISTRRRLFYDDTEIRLNAPHKFRNESKSENRIKIDLSSKVPRVTAILHGGHLISSSYNNIKDPITPFNSSVGYLRNNLHKNAHKNIRSRSPKNLNNFDKLVESHLSTKFNKVLSKKHSLKSPNPKMASSRNINKDKDKDFDIKELIRDISNNNLQIGTKTSSNNNNLYQNNLKIINNQIASESKNVINYTTNAPKIANTAQLAGNKNIPPNDSISISAVTYNNEVCLNSSQLEIMENVLNLDGINTNTCVNKASSKCVTAIKKPHASSNAIYNTNTYTHKYLNKMNFNSLTVSKTPHLSEGNDNASISPRNFKRAVSMDMDNKEKEKDIFQVALQKMLSETEDQQQIKNEL